MSDAIIGYSSGKPVRIALPDRRHHLAILGQTGSGKSTLAFNMAVRDIHNGQSLCVIDPHGDLVQTLLAHIPKSRTNDVVYINPSDTHNPVGFNILEVPAGQQKELVVSSVVSVFRHLFRNSWGARTEYTLHNTIAALLDTPDTTLVDTYRMLIDPGFRRSIIENVQDPLVRVFWTDVFGRYTERFASEVLSPIQNKVGQFLTGSYLRNILGQPKSTFDLNTLMDNPSIVLVNLAKGRIGEDRANLLGSLLITRFYLAALQRQDIPEEQRRDFFLYVDEYESFATDAFPSILSEARKYHLNLVLLSQYMDQVPRDISRGVLGNVGNWVVFRVGNADAEILTQEFSPYIKLEQLQRQRNFSVIYKLLSEGVSTVPRSTTTLPLKEPEGTEADPETIIRVSKERYGRPRDQVEKKILTPWETALGQEMHKKKELR